MKKLVCLALLVAATMFSSVAFAENKAGTFNVSPFAGGYYFDSFQKLRNSLIYGLRAGYNFTDNITLEGSATIGSAESKVVGGHFDILNYRMEALYHFMPQKSFVPFLAAGFGGYRVKEMAAGKTNGGWDCGVGAKYFITDSIALRADLKAIYLDTTPSILDNYEATLGLSFSLGKAKKAPLPVKETASAPKAAAPAPAPAPKAAAPAIAPKVAAPAPKAADSALNPLNASDSKQSTAGASDSVEGIAPAPVAKLTATPDSINQGSSVKLSWTSQNSTDCELNSGGPVQTSGSLMVVPSDTTVYKLSCKGSGGSADSSANVRVILDSDKDGVPDSMDKCPGTPQKTKVDQDGCPVVLCESATLDITFDTNKYEILPRHHSELDLVAAKMKKFPKSKAVIEGHTDNVGTGIYNKKLSIRRADAVKKYLVEKQGIAVKRLTSKGFGETKPVDTNATEEGRSKNRRVDSVFTCPE